VSACLAEIVRISCSELAMVRSVSEIRLSSSRLKCSVFLTGGTLMTSMLRGYYPTKRLVAAVGEPLLKGAYLGE
jgi:hypothetical protein